MPKEEMAPVKVIGIRRSANQKRDLRIVVEIGGEMLDQIGLIREETRQWTAVFEIPSDRKIEQAIEAVFRTHSRALRICASEHAVLTAVRKALDGLEATIKERTGYVEDAVVAEEATP